MHLTLTGESAKTAAAGALTFDVVHDAARPLARAAAIRRALRSGGRWLAFEIRAAQSPESAMRGLTTQAACLEEPTDAQVQRRQRDARSRVDQVVHAVLLTL